MKVETLGHLVDTKDLYQALAEFKTMDFLPAETKRFLAFQIRKTCREMKKTAIYVQTQMDEMAAYEKSMRAEARKAEKPVKKKPA